MATSNNTPSLRRRLSLSPIITSWSPRALLRRRNSTPPQPATVSPVLSLITASGQHTQLKTPATEPLTACCATCEEGADKGLKHDWEPQYSQRIQDKQKVRQLERELGLQPLRSALGPDPFPTEADDAASQATTEVEGSEETAGTSYSSVASPLMATPVDAYFAAQPGSAQLSSTTSGELEPVREADEYKRTSFGSVIDTNLLASLASPTSPSSPSTPSPYQAVWLCSRPSRTPTPVSATPGSMRKNKSPVVRSYSTARLAQAFDDQGRVICLSTHSEKVIHASRVCSPLPSPATFRASELPRAMSDADIQQLGNRKVDSRPVPHRAMTSLAIGSLETRFGPTEFGQDTEDDEYPQIKIKRRNSETGWRTPPSAFGSLKRKSVRAWNEYIRV